MCGTDKMIYIVIRYVKSKGGPSMAIVLGAWVDPAKASRFMEGQQARKSLHEAARVFGGEITHQIIPLEVQA